MEIEFPGQPAPRVDKGAEAAPAGTGRPRPGETAPAGGDAVTITPAAEELRRAEARIASVSEVDQEAVDRVREAISNGAYRTDPLRVAEKMLALEAQLGG